MGIHAFNIAQQSMRFSFLQALSCLFGVDLSNRAAGEHLTYKKLIV
jgi:hypothetical protein